MNKSKDRLAEKEPSVNILLKRRSFIKNTVSALILAQPAISHAESISELFGIGETKKRLTHTLKNSSHLKVNPEKNFYKIWKSRKKGEEDLIKLAQTAELEEAWFFVEYTKEIGLWIECGKDEAKDRTNFEYGQLEHIKLLNRIKKISFYHHHPEHKTTKDSYLSQTPSVADIMCFYKILAHIKNKYPCFENKIDFRIAVTTGIYIITIDPKILIPKDPPKNRKFLYLPTPDYIHMLKMRMDRESKTSSFDYRPSNRHNFAHENIEFAKKHSAGEIQMIFIPK